MTEGYANGMKLETSEEAVAAFRAEFRAWVKKNPTYNAYELIAAFSPTRLYARAVRDAESAAYMAAGPLYRDYMRIVGHVEPKPKANRRR